MSPTPRFSSVLALSTISMVLVSAASLPAQTTLRWKFQEGQRLAQVIEQDMVMNAKAGQLDIQTAMKQTIDATWHVMQVDDQGTATIKQNFTRIRMKMDALGNGFEFDSNDPKELQGIGAIVAPALRALASTEFKVTMSATGKIDSVEVSDEAIKALQSLPGGAQMGGMFTKDGLIKMIKQGSHHFPEEAIKQGDSWAIKSENELPQVGTMSTVAKLTYVGPKVVDNKKLEQIKLEVTTTLPEGGSAVVALKDQTANGLINFDNEAGRIADSTLVQNMTLAVKFGGQAIDQNIKQTIKVRVSEMAN